MRCLLLIILAACSAETVHEGISVGNPSLTTITTARSAGITLTSGQVRLNGVGVRDDDGNVFRTNVGETFDLLGNDSLEIPEGDWRRVTLHFGGDIRYQGIADDGRTVRLQLTVPEVRLVPEDVDLHAHGAGYVAELAFPSWLELAQPLSDVEPGSPLHDTLAQSVGDASALYFDIDEDGELSSEERTERAASGSQRPSQ